MIAQEKSLNQRVLAVNRSFDKIHDEIARKKLQLEQVERSLVQGQREIEELAAANRHIQRTKRAPSKHHENNQGLKQMLSMLTMQDPAIQKKVTMLIDHSQSQEQGS